jgi:GcrA cell cycle regulator
MEGSIILRRRRRTTAKSPWTPERVEYSTARWSEGASARQISRELGHGISRSAVLGLIYRLGIADLSPFGGRRGRRSDKKAAGAKKAGGAKKTARAKKNTTAKGARARKRTPAPCPVWTSRRPSPAWVVNAKTYLDDPGTDAEIPRSQRRSLMELTDDTCRWPVGDPSTVDFFFCGAQPLPDKPYCAAHCARAERIDEALSASAPPAASDDARDRQPTEWEEA